MSALTVAFLGLLPFAWSLIATRLSSSPVTGPLFMMVAGVLLGPTVADLIDLGVGAEVVTGVFTATLVLVLFTDAAHIDVAALRRHSGLPARLLGVGLPLTIVVGAMVGWLLLPSLAFWPIVVLAVAVAPTDAALGSAVIENERVPASVRQSLNTESGLNDGIAVPLFLIAVAGAEGDESTVGEAAATIVQLIGVAVVAGAVVGLVGIALVRWSAARGWSSSAWRAVATPLLAFVAYGLADALGGSGFVAAFAAGAMVAATCRGEVAALVEGGESIGHLLTLVSFLIFGASVVGPTLADVTRREVVYAVASLTVVRMVPVAMAALGSGFAWHSVAFIGWFGPRGLASVIFAAELLSDAPFESASTVAHLVTLTVALSVVAHGVTAGPLANRYADWVATQRDLGPEMNDSGPVAGRRHRV